MRYMLLSVDDARWLAQAVDGCAGRGPSTDYNSVTGRMNGRDVVGRLEAEEGGDFEELVALLKKCAPCAAGVIEGIGCGASFEAQKIGRRLDRLLERAQPGGRGHRLPAPPAKRTP